MHTRVAVGQPCAYGSPRGGELDCHATRGCDRYQRAWGQGAQGRCARLRLEPRHRDRVDRAGVQHGGDAGLHRRRHRRRRARAGGADCRVHSDPVRLRRLSLLQPRRPGRRDDVRVGDARLRAPARMGQRLGDLPRRHHRDGVAVRDRRELHLPPVRPARLGELEPRPDHRRDRVDRADDVDLLPRHRAVGAGADDPPERRDLHARAVRGRRADQGLRQQSGPLDSRNGVVVQPVRYELGRAGRCGPARHLHLLGLGLGRRRQRGVARPPSRTRQGRGRLDPDPAPDLRHRRGRGTGISRHGVPRRQLERRPERARHGRVRLAARQAADHHAC